MGPLTGLPAAAQQILQTWLLWRFSQASLLWQARAPGWQNAQKTQKTQNAQNAQKTMGALWREICWRWFCS